MRDRIDSRPITILKIGGSLLTETDGFGEAVAEVRAHVDRGHDVVAVVSAMNGTTDRLWAAAHELAERPDAKLLSSLLATGEDAAAALFGIALRQAPTIEAAVLSALELGLVTEGPDLDATPVAIDANRIRQLLRTRGVVVAPGFVGRSAAGDPTILGRGGSDLTALFLAAELDAVDCRLLKDVGGLFTSDPKRDAAVDASRSARRYERATWDEVMRIGGGVVQPKAVRFAKRHGTGFQISPFGSVGTSVGRGPNELHGAEA